jgi:hypothetical protein
MMKKSLLAMMALALAAAPLTFAAKSKTPQDPPTKTQKKGTSGKKGTRGKKGTGSASASHAVSSKPSGGSK